MFPALAFQILDGIEATLEKKGDLVTIFSKDGKDITEEYKDILLEFIQNTWPGDVGLAGTLLHWSGPSGYLSGDLVEPEKARSHSFHVNDLTNGERLVKKLESDIWSRHIVLQEIFPANGGFRIILSVPILVYSEDELRGVHQRMSSKPGNIGLRLVSEDNETMDVLLSQEHRLTSLFSAGPDFFNVDIKETTPDYLIFESPLFPYGSLVDGRGNVTYYPKEEVEKAVRASFLGNSLSFVNFGHIREETTLVGIILKVWWDADRPFSFTDHKGNKVEGVGMLMQRSVITDKTAIWNVENGKITSVSNEPYFDVIEGEARNIAITGLALTNHPAIPPAIIEKVCDEVACKTLL